MAKRETSQDQSPWLSCWTLGNNIWTCELKEPVWDITEYQQRFLPEWIVTRLHWTDLHRWPHAAGVSNSSSILINSLILFLLGVWTRVNLFGLKHGFSPLALWTFVGGYHVHCKMCRCISSLYSLDANSSFFSGPYPVMTKKVCRHCQMSSGGEGAKLPQVENHWSKVIPRGSWTI